MGRYSVGGVVSLLRSVGFKVKKNMCLIGKGIHREKGAFKKKMFSSCGNDIHPGPCLKGEAQAKRLCG